VSSKAVAKRDAINAAMDLAGDISAGKVDPSKLDVELAERCRELFGIVVGPEDPLFELQRDVARQVLATGGLSVAEVLEWEAVLKRRAGTVEPPSRLETPDGPDTPGEGISSASGPHSPENEAPELETGPEVGP